jgi:hypothetical protein
MPQKIQTKDRLVATFTLGQNLQPNTKTFVDLSKIEPYINFGFKSMLMRLRFKISATWGSITPPGSGALSTLFLKYLLNTEVRGPGNFYITQDRRGWHDYLWEYMQRGEIDWIRGLDIPQAATSATRTWTQAIDFEEPRAKGPISRCWPIEAFRAPNAGLWITWKDNVTIKGFALGAASSVVIKVYAEVFDVPANAVPLPPCISEFAVQTNSGEVNPSPGIGKYVRILMANSPVPDDNLGGAATDDLSAYTVIDYFGLQNNYSVLNADVDQYISLVNQKVAIEQHSQLNTNTGNKGEFRLIDPQENFDGILRAIPLVFPNAGDELLNGPTYADFPKLGANGGNRAGLPAGFFFLCQRVDPRTDAILNATVGALTSSSSNQSVQGRPAQVARGFDVPGIDKSRVPLLINCT